MEIMIEYKDMLREKIADRTTERDEAETMAGDCLDKIETLRAENDRLRRHIEMAVFRINGQHNACTKDDIKAAVYLLNTALEKQ